MAKSQNKDIREVADEGKVYYLVVETMISMEPMDAYFFFYRMLLFKMY